MPDQCRALVRVLRSEPFERVRHLGVEAAPVLGELRAIGHLVEERMAKRVKVLGSALAADDALEELHDRMRDRLPPVPVRPQVHDQAVFGERLERLLDLLRRQPRHTLENLPRELLAEDGCRLENGLVPLAERIDARVDHGLHRRRQHDLVDRPDSAVVAFFSLQLTARGHRPDDLLDEERIPFAALDDPLDQARHRRVVAEEPRDQRARRSNRGDRARSADVRDRRLWQLGR
jgi:hypothetical protein